MDDKAGNDDVLPLSGGGEARRLVWGSQVISLMHCLFCILTCNIF